MAGRVLDGCGMAPEKPSRAHGVSFGSPVQGGGGGEGRGGGGKMCRDGPIKWQDEWEVPPCACGTRVLGRKRANPARAYTNRSLQKEGDAYLSQGWLHHGWWRQGRRSRPWAVGAEPHRQVEYLWSVLDEAAGMGLPVWQGPLTRLNLILSQPRFGPGGMSALRPL